MATTLTFDEMVRGMLALGISRDKAERTARHNLGIADASQRFIEASRSPVQPRSPVPLPFSMSIPWSHLCSDNEKETGRLFKQNGVPKPGRVLTARYKAAKEWIRTHAKDLVGDALPVEDTLSITVTIFLPPARRNDPLNFGKVLHDALEGVVYANDGQLHRILYERGGVDIDAPRAEVTIDRLTSLTARRTA